MSLIKKKYITRFTAITALSSLLMACSSPVKYQPRDSQSEPNKVEQAPEVKRSCISPYVVKSGDTLSGIAYQCDLKMVDIATQNHLLPPYIIYVKQELILPQTQEPMVVARTIEPSKKAPQKVELIEPEHKTKNFTKPAPEQSEVTAKALTRTETTSETFTVNKSKNKAWQWPMHKGLSYKYLRDNAGLSVLEIYGVPGQKVTSVAPGKVVYAGNGIINYGWMLVVKHDNDYMSIYAHNSALLVKEGDTVNAGEAVATMGATGNTKRPKLYVEARYQGRKIDIKKILKQ